MTDTTVAVHRSAMLRPQFVQLVLLTVAAAAGYYAATAVSPVQESLRISLALTDNQMGLLQGPALALPMVIATLPLGSLLDRYSRVRLLLIFIVMNVFGNVITALAPGFATLFAARSLVGLCSAAIATAAFSILADLYSPEERGFASMLVMIGQNGGMAAAFAVGGALLGVYGPHPDAWRKALIGVTAPLILAALICVALREPPRLGGAEVAGPGECANTSQSWSVRGILIAVGGGLALVQVGIYAASTWAAPMLERRLAVSPERVGALLGTVLLVSGILGPLLGGPLADICQRSGGPRRTLWALIWVSLLGVPSAFFAVAANATLAGVLLGIFMTVTGAICVTSLALFTIVSPSGSRGFYMAVLMGALTLLGIGVAPLAVSSLSNALGGLEHIGRALCTVCMTANVGSALAFAIALTSFNRRRQVLSHR